MTAKVYMEKNRENKKREKNIEITKIILDCHRSVYKKCQGMRNFAF